MAETDQQRDPLTDASKEKIKLRAAFLNGIGIATFAVGALAPLIRAIGDEAVTPAATVSAVVLSPICFALAGVLHLQAQRQLERLDT